MSIIDTVVEFRVLSLAIPYTRRQRDRDGDNENVGVGRWQPDDTANFQIPRMLTRGIRPRARTNVGNRVRGFVLVNGATYTILSTIFSDLGDLIYFWIFLTGLILNLQ